MALRKLYETWVSQALNFASVKIVIRTEKELGQQVRAPVHDRGGDVVGNLT